jgi:hypothetical protein
MTLKPSGRARIDTRHDLQDRRKLAWVNKKIKKLIIILFDYCGVFHTELAPTGVTVNQKYYLEVLDSLSKRVMWDLHTSQITTAHAKSFQSAVFLPVVSW